MRLRPGLIGALGMGAVAMFLLDPQLGTRRRALLRDKMLHLGRRGATATGRGARDLRNRARGKVHELVDRLRRAPVDDRVLTERVRARLGHAVTHPAAIAVSCENGRCTLAGPLLAGEHEGLLAAVAAVPGIGEVIDLLERHETAAGVPGLH